jgi:hypothetical protein
MKNKIFQLQENPMDFLYRKIKKYKMIFLVFALRGKASYYEN